MQRVISNEFHMLGLRDNMEQDCCSPLCDRFDECDALGILKYMKIVIQDPRKEVKDWCQDLTLQSHQDIEGGSRKE